MVQQKATEEIDTGSFLLTFLEEVSLKVSHRKVKAGYRQRQRWDLGHNAFIRVMVVGVLCS